MKDTETRLRSLLCGEFATLNISFNDHSLDYRTAEQAEEAGAFEDFNWVSEEERTRAIAGNSVWVIWWYPNSPVAFKALVASTLEAVLSAAASEPSA